MNTDSNLNMTMDGEGAGDNNQKAKRLVVIVLVVLGCVVLSVVGCFAGVYWLGSQRPENISVEVNEPDSMELGQEGVLSITITNTGTEPLELNSIGIGSAYLDGFLVGDVEPTYSDVTQYDSSNNPRQVYEFYLSIAPDETLVVEFQITALHSGNYRNGLEICIDNSFNCRSDIVHTIIK